MSIEQIFGDDHEHEARRRQIEAIAVLAHKYPLHTAIGYRNTTYYVLDYVLCHDAAPGLLVSHLNPATNHHAARAACLFLCADCLDDTYKP